MKALIITAMIVVIAVAAGVILYMNGGSHDPAETDDPADPVSPGDPTIEEDLVYPRELIATSPSQWSYAGGDLGSFGVSDSKTPTTDKEMALAWSVTGVMDSGTNIWKVPSSPLCVGDKVYYYKGEDCTIHCCDVSTGADIVTASCESAGVYTMPMAYGDGKIFVATYVQPAAAPSYSLLKAFDADTLKQLYVGTPVYGQDVQWFMAYYEGKVFMGTYMGGFECFSSEDKDTARPDEVSEPLWAIESDGFCNEIPAFFGDCCVIAKRGFKEGGATALMIAVDTGEVVDSIHFDREFSSSGPTFYEGRVYFPLMRATDRSMTVEKIEELGQNTPEHLAIRSYEVSSDGFELSSERFWESECELGGTQCMAVIWNDTIYIGGGGKTMGTDEPFWIVSIAGDGSMKTKSVFWDLQTKGTAAITTAYSTEENGYAVYIYLMEYGHVNPGEAADSANGYSEIYVIRDSAAGSELLFKLKPTPANFCWQSFCISKDGHLLIKNDSTLFCFGIGSAYTPEDVGSSIDRFIAMSEEGNVNMRDFQRIIARYADLSDSDKKSVGNYQKLMGMCVTVTLKAASGDVTIQAPKGAIVELPDVPVPEGKVLAGWSRDGVPWESFSTPVTSDVTLQPVYADAVRVTLSVDGGKTMAVAKGSALPYIYDPSRDGYAFDGWKGSDGLAYIPAVTKVLRDVALEPVWKKVSVLSFDTDGGSSVEGEFTATYTKPIASLPETVRTGCTFLGWYHDGIRYDAGTVYPFENPIVLTAVWSENSERTVTNGNGLYVTGNFDDGVAVTAVKASELGSTVARLREAIPDAECLAITVKGEGVTGDLSITVSIDTEAPDEDSVKICYYANKTVHEVVGKVSGGKLSFQALGYYIGGAVQLTAAFPPGYGVLEHKG